MMTAPRHDLAIIGAGPAGLAAAIRAAELGLDVVVFDDKPAPGGQIYRDIERVSAENRAGLLGPDYVAGLECVERFRRAGVAYRADAQVWQIERGFTIYATRGGAVETIGAKAVIIAVGATERPVPIPGWTLPGVMTVGAGQILLKTSAIVPEAPIVIAGQGPLMLLYATQLLRAGIRPVAILDTATPGGLWRALPHLPGALANWRDLAKGIGYRIALVRAGISYFGGASAIAALGQDRVDAVRFHSARGERTIEARTLLLHEGIVPHVHMSMALGAEHEWNRAIAAMQPRLDSWNETNIQGLFVAGDAAVIGGASLAGIAGERAALGAAFRLNRISAAERDAGGRPLARRARSHARLRPFLDAMFAPRAEILVPPDEVIVCRCEEVTAGAIRAAVRRGCLGPNQVKSFTRCGMGACQGRQCAVTIQHVVAEARAVDPAALDPLSVRPPLKPLTLGELATLADVEKDAVS